jgi:hypothetical protein
MENNLILSLPNTRMELDLLVNQVVNKILDGTDDPLKIEVKLKLLADTIAEIRKNNEVKNVLLFESDKYPGKTFEAYGCRITKTGKTNYDYSEDTVWKELDAKKKEREKMLKGLTSEMVDPETGEIIKPAKQSYTNFLKIELED